MSLAVVLAVMSLESHGGVADQIATLAMELPRNGVQPIVLVRNPLVPDHNYVRTLHAHGITVWGVSSRERQVAYRTCKMLSIIATPLAIAESVLRHKSFAASMASLWAVLRRLGYAGLDCIFWLRLVQARLVLGAKVVHLRNPDGWQKILWARRLGLRILYTEDTIPQTTTEHYYQGIYHVRQSIDMATAVSNASAIGLRPFIGPEISVAIIPNIILTPPGTYEPKPITKGRFVLGCLARLAPEKDIKTLLRAFELASTQNSCLQLLIYGDGPERSSLEALAGELKCSQEIVFSGVFAKDQLPEVMEKLHLVVQSSVYEGFGVALAEGMAFGKPVVATDVGGVRDVVVNGVTGFLVPTRNPKALAEAILTLCDDWQLYEKMARAARERYLALFTPENVVPRYVALYGRLVT